MNHCDYRDVEISYANLSEYSETEPPVIVDYQEVDTTKDAKFIAVNDKEDKDGTSEGLCPFTVTSLTSEKLT